MNGADMLRAVLAATAGTFVGWAGAALTLHGRVDAIEAAVLRIESRIDGYIVQQMNQQNQSPKPKANP